MLHVRVWSVCLDMTVKQEMEKSVHCYRCSEVDKNER